MLFLQHLILIDFRALNLNPLKFLEKKFQDGGDMSKLRKLKFSKTENFQKFPLSFVQPSNTNKSWNFFFEIIQNVGVNQDGRFQ
jgi:hypothetical protein